jgi:excisionase family DNA binding protein
MITKLYTIKEVAEIFSVDRMTIYRWVNEGKLIPVRLPSGTLRVSQIEVDRLSMPQDEANHGRTQSD